MSWCSVLSPFVFDKTMNFYGALPEFTQQNNLHNSPRGISYAIKNLEKNLPKYFFKETKFSRNFLWRFFTNTGTFSFTFFSLFIANFTLSKRKHFFFSKIHAFDKIRSLPSPSYAFNRVYIFQELSIICLLWE